MEQLLYFGDDALKNLVVRMDQLTEFKLKFRAAQYLEDLRNEVLSDNVYKSEDDAENHPELIVDTRQRVLQRTQVEILKMILPKDRNSHLAIKLMKCIQENHFKMTDVHEELKKSLKQQHDKSLEECTRELEEKNRNFTMENSYKRLEARQQESKEDTKRRMITKIQVELLKLIKENHSKLVDIHQELLNKLEHRDGDAMKESVRKLEESDQNKWLVTLTEWSKTNRERILYSILVGLVRKIRKRRCPQMAAKIMKKLQDHNLILHKLQEELVVKVKERESLKQRKQIVEKELVMKVKMLEEMRETRKRIHLELMIKVKMLEEMKETRKRMHKELMNYHLKKNELDDDFVPRKLFLTGVNTFSSLPKLEVEIMNEGKKEPSTSQPEEQEPASSLKSCASNPRRSIKNRIKRFFGIK